MKERNNFVWVVKLFDSESATYGKTLLNFPHRFHL